MEVERGGETLAVHAVPSPDPADRARINALTATKYGWAESFYAMVGGGGVAIPIRSSRASKRQRRRRGEIAQANRVSGTLVVRDEPVSEFGIRGLV